MKKDIHPKFYTDSKITCACGNTFKTGAVLPQINVEICSKCHPFYTGKEKMIDSAGRVEKFIAKAEKGKVMKKKKKIQKKKKED